MRRTIEVVVSGSAARVSDLTLRRPGRIEGVVEDVAAEALLDGVAVTLLDANGSTLTSALTDETGTYRFEGLAPGAYRVVCQAPRGYSLAVAEANLMVPPGETVEHHFELEPAGALEGRVVDEDTGEPLVGVPILLLDSVGRVVRKSTTAADGTYAFRRLPEDKYTVALEET